MSNLKISELNESTTAPATSYIPIDDGELTTKITVENFNATGAASAAQSAAAAALSESTASTAATTATTAATEATTAKTQAVSAKTAAETAQGYAEAAQNSAEAAQSAAESAASSITSAAATAVDKADEATQAATTATTAKSFAQSYAEQAEAWGVGTVSGTPVSDTDEQYHNNSKYYCEQANSGAVTSLSYAGYSEAYAVGTEGGVDVEPGHPAYHNNSYYYADQAADSEIRAGESASYAADHMRDAGTYATTSRSYAVGDTESRTGETTDNAKYYSQQAASSAAAAEAWSAHPPYIGANGDWYVYDTTTSAYVDSGVDASISITVGTVSSLSPGSGATVTNTGTSTDAVLNFGIEQGEAGFSPEVTITTITGGHRVTITDEDHPQGQSFDVMDGSGGGGGGDMYTSTYDDDLSVANVGGIPAYVSSAVGSKTDKVSSATSGNFAGLDSSGNLTDSGSKASDFLTSHQDISGKADKVSSPTSGNFAGLDSNGNLTDSGSKASDFLTSHQDISGKADKVTSATNGNFAGLDSNGNLTDSGSKASDFAAANHSHAWSDITNKPFNTIGNGLTVSDNALNADVRSVSVATTGTASSTGIAKQQITINGTATDIQGTARMSQSITLSTADPVQATFTNAAITANSWIDVFVSDYSVCPTSVSASNGSCVIIFAKVSVAQTITVGIEVS